MSAVVTISPRNTDCFGNYPVKVDGAVVGWGSVRPMRNTTTSFHFYPLGGSGQPAPYDFSKESLRFDGISDLKARLPDLLAKSQVEERVAASLASQAQSERSS